jgi:hypothetical protein
LKPIRNEPTNTNPSDLKLSSEFLEQRPAQLEFELIMSLKTPLSAAGPHAFAALMHEIDVLVAFHDGVSWCLDNMYA